MSTPHWLRAASIATLGVVTALVVTACNRASSGPSHDVDPRSPDGRSCAGGACDSVERPALARIDLSRLVSCWTIPDTTATEFFRRDEVRCRLASVQAPGLVLARILATIETSRATPRSAYLDPLRAGDAVTVGVVTSADYPVTLTVTILVDLESHVLATREVTRSSDDVRFGAERPVATRAALVAFTESAPWTMGLPFDLDPVMLWPSTELLAVWGTSSALALSAMLEQSITVAPTPLQIGGAPPTTALSGRLDAYLGASDPGALDRLASLVTLPVPRAGALHASLHLNVSADDGDRSRDSVIDAPGYYLIGPDGTIVRGDPARLPALPAPVVGDAGAVGDLDGGLPDAGDGIADAGPFDAADAAPVDAAITRPDAGPPPDPCAGACTTSEACVAGACVPRSRQAQAECWVTPGAICDPGEDADCAALHACVGGLCRKLSCQVQSECWNTPDRPCDSDDLDCAASHVCVGGLCRRRSCQQQSECWSTPDRPCEGDDDTDCADGNICAESLCRKLACQRQSECWETPSRTCDLGDSGDCATGNACVSRVCARTDCP